jgi:hypothetical protein
MPRHGDRVNDMPWESDDARTAALDRFSIALLGTKTTDEDEETRAWLATDWLVRVHSADVARASAATPRTPQALRALPR